MSLFKRGRPKFDLLRIRKLADKSDAQRIVKFDPDTGEKRLVNPLTPGDVHEPWPLAGIQFEGPPPAYTTVSQSFVTNALSEGWLSLENSRQVTRPGGPPEFRENPSQAHNFLHADALVFNTVDGAVRYKVLRQPDKYVEGDDEASVTDEVYNAGRTVVDWHYELELVV